MKKLLKNKFVISTLRKLFPIDPNNRYINLGGGDWYYPRWENIDLKANSVFTDYRLDLSKSNLPFDDNTVQLIFSQNFIYYLTEASCKKLFEECYRVLMTHGCIHIGIANNDIPEGRQIQDTMLEVKTRFTPIKLTKMLMDAKFGLSWNIAPRKSINKTLRGFMFDRKQEYIFHVEAYKV